MTKPLMLIVFCLLLVAGFVGLRVLMDTQSEPAVAEHGEGASVTTLEPSGQVVTDRHGRTPQPSVEASALSAPDRAASTAVDNDSRAAQGSGTNEVVGLGPGENEIPPTGPGPGEIDEAASGLGPGENDSELSGPAPEETGADVSGPGPGENAPHMPGPGPGENDAGTNAAGPR